MKVKEIINESEFAAYYDEFIDELEGLINRPINSDDITMVQHYYGIPDFSPQLAAKIINKDFADGSVEQFFDDYHSGEGQRKYQGV